MNDKELLERAAKAAGYAVHESTDGTMQNRPVLAFHHFVQGQEYGEVIWNPLSCDADAFRLAVKLKIEVLFARNRERSLAVHYAAANPAGEDHDGDPYAATRRAIVRAAAALVEGE